MSDRPPADDGQTRTALGAATLAAGHLLAGRYRILGRLGAGGMGLVYRAHDERLDVDVAVKVLRPEHGGDGEVAKRFTRELLLARQVSHRHVVRIHDIGEQGELAFLTMDLVEGRTLKQVLASDGRLEPARAVEVVSQLAEALAEAHREGVVHRDLKPSNVLIGDDGDAYLTDFGVARSLDATGLTGTGGVVGTLAYLSPEQARGDKVDGKSDVFSLGLLLYEMLTGETAFPEGTWSEVIGRRIGGRPESLRRRAPGLPEWLYLTVERCLERDPERRCDAGELAAGLAAEGAPGGATVGRRDAAPAWWRRSRRRFGWAAASLLGVATVVAVYLAGWGGDGGNPAAAAAESPIHALAILPFATEADAAWANGAAEVLASALAENRSLQVVDSLRVAQTVRDLRLPAASLSEADLAQLAELLDADRLLAGRLTAVPGRVRFDGRLAAVAARGVRVETLSAEGADLLAALDSLAGELRRRLEVDREQELAAPPASRDDEALAAYAEGVARLQQGDVVGAAPALERAVETDPHFASAWLRLASAYEGLGYHGKADEALRRAVEELPAASGRIGFEARARLASVEGDGERAVALLRQLVETYPHDSAARVALANEYEAQGRFADATSVLQEVVERDENHPQAWYLLGRNAIRSGDYRRAAEDYLVRALVVQNRLRNRMGQADAVNARGMALMNLGDLDGARASFEQAADLRREIGDRRGVAASLNNLGLVELQRGDTEAARRSYERSLTIRRDIGDKPGEATTYNRLGLLDEEQGHYRQALDRYRQALELRRGLGDDSAVAESLNNVGYAYYLLGELDNAAVYWDRAMALFERIDNPEGVLLTRQNRGLLHLVRADWEDALADFLATLDGSRELGLVAAEAVALGNLGRVAQHQGRYGAALGSYREALARVGELEDPRGLVEYHLMVADAALDLGLGAAAAEHLAAAGRWLAEGGNAEQRAEHARLTGEQALVGGASSEAKRQIDRAREEAEQSGSRVQQLLAALAGARFAAAGGRPAEAARQADEVASGARALGHVVIEIEALATAAAARLDGGDATAAAASAGAALRLARQHAPYGAAYRLHRLRALTLEASGKGDSAAAWSAAAAEVERLRGDLDGEARAAFDRLPAVREIESRAGRAAA